MIVDEAHRLKAGTRGKLFQALTGLNTNHRVLLTGTPLQVSEEAVTLDPSHHCSPPTYFASLASPSHAVSNPQPPTPNPPMPLEHS